MADVPWIVRFVDAPNSVRGVRFDCNSGTEPGDVYTRADGFSLGTTEYLVAMVESMLADDARGDQVTATRKSNRELVIPLVIVGDADDFATAMGDLAREVDRGRTYLEFKPGEHTGESVFFTVKQGDINEVDPDPEDDWADNESLAQLTLLCEPVAVGLPVESASATSVSNNPATGQHLSLPDIRGDVATHLNVELANTGLPAEGVTALVSVHTNPDDPASVFAQAETAAAGVDTALAASGVASMSGSGINYLRTTFATNTGMATRVAFDNLTVAFGRYKVLLRVRKSGATGQFRVRRTLDTGVASWSGKTVTYDTTTTVGPHWLDLGQVTLPAGGAIPPGTTSGLVGSLQIDAERLSASGSLDFDCLMLVPVEMPNAPQVTTSITWQQWGWAFSGEVATIGLNAEDDEIWTENDGLVGFTALRRAGALPKVHPGHDNHLVLMRHVGTIPGGTDQATVSADSITWNTSVTWSYRPRFLYVSEPA